MNFNDRYKKEDDLTQHKQLNNANNQSKKMRKNVVLEDHTNENEVKIGDTKIKDEKKIKNKGQIMQKIRPTTMIFAGEKSKQDAETSKQNYNTNIVMKSNNEINNNIIETNHPEENFDPFSTCIEIWQNYSIYWINKIKEIIQSTTDWTRNVEIAREKESTNNAIYQWFGTNTR